MATLLLFLQEILPLPSFDVWLADRRSNLSAHLEEEFSSAPAHLVLSPPVTVASRVVALGPDRWRATLNLFRRDGAWRGFIRFRIFQAPGEEEGLRTGDIFREDDPEAIRDRFVSLRPQALRAFLRSVL
jgi:hypothetical protein